MDDKNKVDVYELEDLIQRLEDIKYNLSHTLNIPKALYSLAKEIEKIKINQES